MATYSIATHKARLDAAFVRAGNIEDLQAQADLACYLCVLVAGYLEQAARHILGDFAARKAHPSIARFAERRLGAFTNANSRKLCDLVGDFDAQFRERMEDFVSGERKDAIDSVIANRHQIAHGRDVGLTIFRISAYYNHVLDTVAFLEVEFAQ